MNPYQSQSKSFQKLNPHLFPNAEVATNVATIVKPQTMGEVQVKPRKPTLNKMELLYLERLLSMSFAHIYVQDVTLRIGDDCRYTPDFVTVTKDRSVTAHEVKGFVRDDALVKLKVAARMFPWIRFVMVRRKDGEWHFTQIDP